MSVWLCYKLIAFCLVGEKASGATLRPSFGFWSRFGTLSAGIHRRAGPTDARRPVISIFIFIIFFYGCFKANCICTFSQFSSTQDCHWTHRPIGIRGLRVRQSFAHVSGRLRLAFLVALLLFSFLFPLLFSIFTNVGEKTKGRNKFPHLWPFPPPPPSHTLKWTHSIYVLFLYFKIRHSSINRFRIEIQVCVCLCLFVFFSVQFLAFPPYWVCCTTALFCLSH